MEAALPISEFEDDDCGIPQGSSLRDDMDSGSSLEVVEFLQSFYQLSDASAYRHL